MTKFTCYDYNKPSLNNKNIFSECKMKQVKINNKQIIENTRT